ncbi:MAG: hypothetical protein KJ722_06990 [Candidatus Omnitrophica bacterium]|nr:hypothetical protein [Candidatus Omnitrophota bacterium]
MLKRAVVLSAIILTIFIIDICFAEETITITTYYPSPYGSYNNLTVANNLTVLGSAKINGSVIGYSDFDIVAYIQKVACENRRGVWVDGTGCSEYAYFTGQTTFSMAACAAGYHVCTFFDLFSGGLASLRRPGYNNGNSYAWVAGSYASAPDHFFYPWGYGNSLQCNAGTHYMMNTRRSAAGNNAWGCYVDSYTGASAACCRNNQ